MFGVIANLPFSGSFEEIEVLRVEDITISQLVEMRKLDGQVRALMRVLTLPIRSTGYAILPADGGDEEGEFITDMLGLPPSSGGMTVSYNKFIRQVLLSLVEGFSAFELVYQIPETGPLKGKITLRKAAHRDSTTVKFLADETGGFNGFRQKTTYHGREIDVKIKKEYSWYYAANEEENPLYGVSYFLPAYYHWDKKRKLYYLMHLAAQFHAVPGRVGEYPENAAKGDRDSFGKALQNFGLMTSMQHPAGWKVTEFNGRSGFDFIPAIDHQNSMMSKSVLAQFIDLGQQEGKGSSYALSEDQSDLFVMCVESVMKEISEGISHYLLPKFIDWNFGSDKYPEFRFNPIADSTKDVLKEAFKTLAAATTTNVSPEFMLELELKMADRLGLDIDVDAIRKQFEKERELEKEKSIELLKAPPPAPIVPGPPAVGGDGAGKKPPSIPGPRQPVEKVAASRPKDSSFIALDAASAKVQPKTPSGRFASGSQAFPSARAHGVGNREADLGKASVKDLKAARVKANEVFEKAPVPTEADRIAHAERIAKVARRGGEDRGSSRDRRARREYVVKEFGNGKTCPCVYCGKKLDVDSVSIDRIYPGSVGGKYIRGNIVPTCYKDNGMRNDTPFVRFEV